MTKSKEDVKEYKPVSAVNSRGTIDNKKKPSNAGRPRKKQPLPPPESDADAFERIQSYSSEGIGLRFMPILFQWSNDEWAAFYDDFREEVDIAVARGRLFDELQTIDWLRSGAKSCNNVTALKYYAEMNFGWGGGAGAVDLPSGIEFTIIEPEEEVVDVETDTESEKLPSSKKTETL